MRRLWCACVLASGLALASPVRAGLIIDPLLSSLTPTSGPAQPLSGEIDVATGAPLPISSNTTFDVTGLDAVAGSLHIALDPALANPGAGVLSPTGSFLIPTLFVRLTDGSGVFDLAVPNVLGSFGALIDCPAAYCLSTSFDVETGGPLGNVHVQVYATPEPAPLSLVALGVLALAGARRRALRGVR